MTTATVTMSKSDLGGAYEHCREIARSRARNFYYGLKLTPEPQRSAVYAIYAWMRTGDDLVDDADSPCEQAKQLDAFEETTRRVLDHGANGEFPAGAPAMWAAFADAVESFGVHRTDIDAMLNGLREDLDHTGYDTFEELKRYCGGVASSVGRVCVTIWGVRQGVSMSEALALAERRGLAFQLTNILRDFAEDFDEGRVYLPKDAFEAWDLTPKQLRLWEKPDVCAALVNAQSSIARAEFDASSRLEEMITPSCAPTLWAMTRIYSGLLRKIEERPERIVGQARIRLQSLHKASIAMRALARSRRGEW